MAVPSYRSNTNMEITAISQLQKAITMLASRITFTSCMAKMHNKLREDKSDDTAQYK